MSNLLPPDTWLECLETKIFWNTRSGELKKKTFWRRNSFPDLYIYHFAKPKSSGGEDLWGNGSYSENVCQALSKAQMVEIQRHDVQSEKKKISVRKEFLGRLFKGDDPHLYGLHWEG